MTFRELGLIEFSILGDLANWGMSAPPPSRKRPSRRPSPGRDVLGCARPAPARPAPLPPHPPSGSTPESVQGRPTSVP